MSYSFAARTSFSGVTCKPIRAQASSRAQTPSSDAWFHASMSYARGFLRAQLLAVVCFLVASLLCSRRSKPYTTATALNLLCFHQ